MDVALSRRALRALRLFFGSLIVFLYAPISILLLFSFNDDTTPAFPLTHLTLRWYSQFLSNPSLLAALRTSAIVASLSSAIAVGLGLLAAIAIARRRFVGRAGITALLLSPLVIPYVVFGISLLILIKAVDGILAATVGRVLGLGIHAIVFGHVVLSLPYAILILVPRLETISVGLEEAAQDLGADALETFRRVTLPLIAPAILAAFLIAFTLSFDEYAVASFVAGTEATYPIYLFSQLRFPSLLPQLLAVSAVVLAFSMVLVVTAEVGRRLSERKLGLEVGATRGA